MPKTDLRGSLQEQLDATKRSKSDQIQLETSVEDLEGNIVAYVGASASSPQLLEGRYAYDPDEVIWVDVEKVHDNPYQYRAGGYTEIAQLQDLIDSFNAKGQLQPYIVRPHPDQRLHPGEWQQGFGHRRKYTVKVGKANAGTGRPDAANLIGKVPILIRQLTDSDMAAIAVDENDNREDARAMDKARGYLNLQLAVTSEMADEGLINRLPDGTFAKLASWREVATRKKRPNWWRSLARGASLMQLPKEIRAEFDAPGNMGFLTQAHGLALLTLQDHPQDQKRLLHDAIEAGWSGAEVLAQGKERLKAINERSGQGKLEGTEQAAKTPVKAKSDDASSDGSSSSGAKSGAGSGLSLVPGGASSSTKSETDRTPLLGGSSFLGDTITPSDVQVITPGDLAASGAEAGAETDTKSEQGALVADVATESSNDALGKKARSFMEAALNELEQMEDGNGYDMEDVGWSKEHLKRALDSLRLAKV